MVDKNNDNDDDKKFIFEGKAKIIRNSNVFYNNVQEFNRDLSVLAVHTYIKHKLWIDEKTNKNFVKNRITILDALSATGLRSIRYSLECCQQQQDDLPIEIYANDISTDAIELIEKNIELNNTNNIIVTNDDANMLLYKKKSINEFFTIIDLDPFGCPTKFLDSAIQNIVDGGLLMVTSTDMAVLCGNHGQACYAKYGSVPLPNSKFCHEMAIRIICYTVNQISIRYGKYSQPLLSLSIDFYIRIFFRIKQSKLQAQRSIKSISYILQCKSCESFYLQSLCQEQSTTKNNSTILKPSTFEYNQYCNICNNNQLIIGGPIWSASIHDKIFIKKLQNELIHKFKINNNQSLNTYRRIEGLLQLLYEELDNCPLYYQLDRLCSLICCPMPKLTVFYSIIINGGYKCSLSHAYKNTIKTDAPNEFIWAMIQFIAKKYNSNNSTNNKMIEKRSEYINNIWNKNFQININDKMINDNNLLIPISKQKNLLRYQQNPEQYWGPKSRPKKNNKNEDEDDFDNKKKKIKI